MNNNNSEDSLPTLKELLINNDYVESNPVRLSSRRNAVKPYVPPKKKESVDLVEVKVPKKKYYKYIFCCKFI